MDVLIASRLQFAIATIFHFIFVPLTLGLSIIIAIFQTLGLRKKDDDYRRLSRFFGRLFLLNFALGVVTGITLEFQFGTNWRFYSEYVGDVFGPLLAIEATLAFFLESTFIGVWWFGWGRLNPRLHALSIWLVALASNISGIWILLANGWMQHPVGYRVVEGKAVLEDLRAVLMNGFAWWQILHTLPASYVLAGFFVLGISAYHILKKNEVPLFKKSFRLSAIWTVIFSIYLIIEGHIHGAEIAKTQPEKLAAMEAHWETENGAHWILLPIPDERNEKNILEIVKIPYILSLLAFHNPSAEVKGLKEWTKEERPNVLITTLAFRLMVGLGLLFGMLSFLAFIKRSDPESSPILLKLLLLNIPLPYIAAEMGWIVAEMGRQPWIVYRVLKVRDAVSPLSPVQTGVSLPVFIVIYGGLGIVCIWLMVHYIKRGVEK